MQGGGGWVPPEAAAAAADHATRFSSWTCPSCTLINAPQVVCCLQSQFSPSITQASNKACAKALTGLPSCPAVSIASRLVGCIQSVNHSMHKCLLTLQLHLVQSARTTSPSCNSKSIACCDGRPFLVRHAAACGRLVTLQPRRMVLLPAAATVLRQMATPVKGKTRARRRAKPPSLSAFG